jgi:hypothetical protein
LAAAIGELRKSERVRAIVDRLCVAAIILAAVVTTGYAAQKIVIARRENRDAFAAFGRAVVKEATAHGWRYGIVGGDDEGMLLYVRRTEFLEPEQAASDWNASKLDALVVPDDEIDELVPQLEGGEPKKLLLSDPSGRDGRRYFFLGRGSLP